MDHADVSDARLCGDLVQALDPSGIDLNGDDLGAEFGGRDSQRTGACPDVYDQLARRDAGFGDDEVSEAGLEKVLTETASSLVSGCPTDAGHGA
jgi:hypothetical protein